MPNVLLICSDHHRADYLGFLGHESVQTPNIDALAARGMFFNQCVTPAPICVPARCALASGRHPCRLNATNNSAILPYEVPTLYAQLRNFGYWTAFSGKLHLGGGREPISPLGLPEPRRDGRRIRNFAWGFCDQFETGMEMLPVEDASHPYTRHLDRLGLFQAYRDDRRKRREARERNDLFGEHADFCFDFNLRNDTFVVDHFLQWLEQRDPEYHFFHQVNMTSPHDPFDPSPEFAEKYRRLPMRRPYDLSQGKPRHVVNGSLNHDPDAVTFARRQFCAMVEEIDLQVGRMVEGLKQQDLLDQTIIVYTSDHGEMLGDMGLWGKCQAYDPSSKVPLIMAGPGVPIGKHSEALIEWADLHPTICELLGVPFLDEIDAQPFTEIFRNAAQIHREDQLIVQPHFRCIRTSRYKLIQTFNDIEELYDLDEDPSEQRNLIDSASKTTIRDVRGRLEARLCSVDSISHRG